MMPAPSSRATICEAVGFDSPESSPRRLRVSTPCSSSRVSAVRSLVWRNQDGVPGTVFADIRAFLIEVLR